ARIRYVDVACGISRKTHRVLERRAVRRSIDKRADRHTGFIEQQIRAAELLSFTVCDALEHLIRGIRYDRRAAGQGQHSRWITKQIRIEQVDCGDPSTDISA